MIRSPGLGLTIALAGLAMSAIAPLRAHAAGLPGSQMNELKEVSDEVAADVNLALRMERSHNIVRHIYSPSDNAPWRDPRAACAQPRNQYIQAFAEFMDRHAQPSPLGDRGENGRQASYIDEELRSSITKAAALPQPATARFLLPGESLKAMPHSWNEALRQRAEWTLVLDTVVGNVVAQARRGPDFADNYIAGVWTLMACDFAEGDRPFLARWSASGAAPSSDRDSAALALLQSRVR
jgi:hypothetical protein